MSFKRASYGDGVGGQGCCAGVLQHRVDDMTSVSFHGSVIRQLPARHALLGL